MRTRYMLYFEKNGALFLLAGIPDAWRKKGKRIVLKNARCLYGKFSLEVDFSDGGTDYRFESDFPQISVYISINGENKRV